MLDFINDHKDFIKVFLAALGGIVGSLLEFFTPLFQSLLVLVTLSYTTWKFYRDYKKHKNQKK